jgi:glycine/D-amino acid oxidase-like deaminating enzyme
MTGRSRLTFLVQSESLAGEDISRRLGLDPTYVSASGRHTSWQLDSPLDDDVEPAAHLSELLPLVEQRLPALRDIEAGDGTASWSCFVTAKPTGNMIWLDPPILARLAEVGIPFVFDVYDSDTD